MNLETLKIANELKAAIEDRIKYGSTLTGLLSAQDLRTVNYPTEKELLFVEVSFGNNSSIKLRDIDQRDTIETAIARNEREIKKLQKEFDNLK